MPQDGSYFRLSISYRISSRRLSPRVSYCDRHVSLDILVIMAYKLYDMLVIIVEELYDMVTKMLYKLF